MFFKHFQPIAHIPTFTPKPPDLQYQHKQTQGPLFDRLPAEIRNQIYTNVFTTKPASTTPSASHRSTAHPLSLLLTCRRVYHEANMLAFSTYTFPLTHKLSPTYLGLRAAVSRLSVAQVDAVRSLSVLSSSDAGTLLSNALIVFPHLSLFTINTERARATARHGLSSREWYRSHHPTAGPHAAIGTARDIDPVSPAISRYALHSLTHLLHTVTSGEAYAWQIGSKWSVQWPQLDSSHIYTKIQCDKDGLQEDLVMDDEAVGKVVGVQMCVCGCGDVSWTRAVLVQEGGRRIGVEVKYYGEADAPEPARKHMPEVILVPGTAPASGVVVQRAGLRYEANEEYWEAIRRKNGNWGALCRAVWRKAVAFENESYSKLTAERG